MPRVTFITRAGEARVIEARAGQTLLDIAWDNKIDIEGACGGCMACSTCHVIVDPAFHDRLPPPGEEEEDLLDLAWGLQPTSRLCCQIVLTEALDGLIVSLPDEANNMLGG
jgi:2Fe-2S ferredoxin